jgi:hypothetical protein
MFTSLFPFGDEVFISNPASKFGKENGVGFAVTVFFCRVSFHLVKHKKDQTVTSTCSAII